MSPNSAMPSFNFTEEQARALTFYKLLLTNEQMGAYSASYRRRRPEAGSGLGGDGNPAFDRLVGRAVG